ncbi:DUF2167 domain-containing protein [Photobacterium sp. J15]|uniref:DUF2167 domain-containing protein n=1 Tax=Photobacterium sp. J15 TaxID=265901 RepID=UPI0007E37AD2|nr:DUF2167 domain-containing protein [Photobacterium sp. J15]
MKFKAFLLSLCFLILPQLVLAESTSDTSEVDDYYEWATSVWNSLERQTGEIKLPAASATLNIPEDFYYLSSTDAETVLVDVWGNPPGQNTLGMIFPAGMTPFDSDSWAVTIRYEEDGYVSDEDANDINYSELLEQMKSDTKEENKDRVSQGYEAIELVGWAAAPYYDVKTHKLHWAKELKFGEDDINTLNYNIRVLGRKGVLVLNFIANMDQKDLIESKLDSVLALAEFEQGYKYTDFNSSTDKMAAYGLGALVAGKVAAKTGFLAAAILFLKKFGMFIVLGIGAFFKKLFRKKKAD